MKLGLILCLLFFSFPALSLPKELYSPEIDQRDFMNSPSWDGFQKLMQSQKQNEQTEGMAYIISGGLAFVGGIVGFHNSNDIFAKGAYAVAQSLGVAAVGYGAHQRQLGNDYRSLYDTLETHRRMSVQERDQFVKVYFDLEKKRGRESEKIAAITHGMLAGLNIYNGATTQQEDLRSALYFIAAINLLASISYSF